MTTRLLTGDCRDVLATLPADSVHCCVTSPPYWGLRDYGVAGQIGLEPTIMEFIDKMVEVFREVRRVLRPDGTLWLNLGDSYSHGGCGSRDAERWPKQSRNDHRVEHAKTSDLKPKDLCGIPWRVAFALQADGWWLRQDIIWSKPNPMPESVTDRCTKAHEYVFLLTKSARYFYDAEAIKEPVACDEETQRTKNKTRNEQRGKGDRNGTYHGRGEAAPFSNWSSVRNRRSVWEIATSPFPEAHFATFPPALVEPCIKAGTSEKGCCGKCGAPWVRKTAFEGYTASADNHYRPQPNKGALKGGIEGRAAGMLGDGFVSGRSRITRQIGWSPSCQCNASAIPCTVLDPFGGAGTTGLVADRLQRNGIIIDINPAYVEMAGKRLFKDSPLFAEISA